MGRRAWLFPLLGAAQALAAQAVNDLNSLILQAERFAVTEMAAQKDSVPLALCILEGTRNGRPGEPMAEASEVQDWRLIYRVLEPERTASRPGTMPLRSLQVTCRQGMLQDIVWLPYPVLDHIDMNRVWIALPLGEAVRILRESGFRSGFTRVSLKRILNPHYPDACTYVFQCPQERATVGISAQTGEVLWKEVRDAPERGGSSGSP